MKKNMGTADRGIRTSLAILAAILYFGGFVTGTIGIVMIILAGVFLLTSFVGFCPLYALLDMDTCPAKNR